MTHLKNYMEEIVSALVKDVIRDMDMCKCEKCILDIESIALNRLPAKYVVTEVGELYAKADAFKQQFKIDVVSAITSAAAIVKKNPQHDSKQRHCSK